MLQDQQPYTQLFLAAWACITNCIHVRTIQQKGLLICSSAAKKVTSSNCCVQLTHDINSTHRQSPLTTRYQSMGKCLYGARNRRQCCTQQSSVPGQMVLLTFWVAVQYILKDDWHCVPSETCSRTLMQSCSTHVTLLICFWVSVDAAQHPHHTFLASSKGLLLCLLYSATHSIKHAEPPHDHTHMWPLFAD
jgi:hypothetical protein